MSWTESDLLYDLSTKFSHTSTPIIKQEPDDKDITWLSINVFEAGKSENGIVPTSNRKNIEYYVYDRGGINEEAWYRVEPINGSALDPISNGLTGNLLTNALYNNITLRQRILGQIGSSAQAVFWEDENTANHSDRLALSIKVLLDTDNYVKCFMMFAALDSDIRDVGALATDQQLQDVVNGWWDYIALNI